MTTRRAARWILPSLALTVVVTAGVYFFAPRRLTQVSSVDGGAHWNAAEAPPRRKVVWQPAKAIDAVGLELVRGDSVIRPQLADGGSTLFFTLRRAGGDANIFRSLLIDGMWREAGPVESINSDSEDIGPILTPDGRTLYLYSDRPGGLGGFDLFVSRRTAEGWGEPQNLGARINSVADEYDPAVSPDGTRLFYSSNRSDQLQKRIAAEGGVSDSKDWPATLRAQATSATFDLYLAERADANSAWQVPRPLGELNRGDASEGTPFVSSNGAFLYFASNRPERTGETSNFDIYRARIVDSQFGQVENLGLGVNSAANEMEPALSNEGFRLYFSRNAEQPGQQVGEQYSLYASTATEITETMSWDDSNLRGLRDGIIGNWSWMIVAALLCGLLAGLIWYLRQVSMKRATVPGFFLSALLIHLLLVGSLFVVALDDDLRNRLKKEVQELVVAVQLNDNPQPKESTPEYGNRADSQNVETVEPADVQRQAVEAPPIEAPSDNPRPAPHVPSELPFVVPREQIVTTQPELKTPDDAPQLSRRDIELDQPTEMVETIELQPVEATAKPEPTKFDVDLTRTRPTAELAASPKMQTPPNAVTPLQPEAVSVERTIVQPATSAVVADAPALVRKAALDVAMAESKAETAEVPAGQPSNSQSAPTSVAVDVARQAARDTSTPIAGLPPRRTMLANTPAVSIESVPVQRPGDQPLEVSSPSKPIVLARADRPAPSDSPVESVPTETVAGPITPPATAEPASTAIEVARQANQNTVKPILPPRSESTNSQAPALTSENVTAERSVAQPAEVASRVEPIVLARAGRTSPQADSPSEAVLTETVDGQATPSSEVATTATAQVNITRQENPSALVPQAATAPTETTFNTPLAAAKVQPSPLALEFVQANPADSPTTLAMLRRPAAAGFESAAEPIETIEPAAGEPGGEANVDLSQSLAVSVTRAGEASPMPKGLPAGLASATAERQLSVDQNAIEVATLDTTPEPRSAEIAASIARVSAATSRDEAEQIATEELAANSPAMTISSTTSIAVAASRSEAQLVESIKSHIGANGSPRTGETSRLAMAALIKDDSQDAPEFGNAPSSLARSTARVARLPFAEDDIGLQAMLRLRQSEAKKDLLEAFGGNSITEAAVELGLNWIELHQHDEGQWSLNRFPQLCEKHHKAHPCTGVGGPSDTAATGFALLPFLGAGHTHQDGQHQEAISRGLKWLVEIQKPDGDLFVGGGGNTHMYSHGIATIALCEAYAMTRDPALRDPAQKAIDFIVAAQHPTSGGWRYTPRQDGDTSVFGWQVMALKSGQMAELNVPQATLDKAKQWLTFVGATGVNEGRFGYTNASPTVTMTAEALLCLQYLGGERNDPRLIAGSKFLAENLPTKETSYYWYYGTQVMFHMQGEPWQKWNAALQNSLVETQVKQGSMAGTWDPNDNWEKTGGRVYSTALRLLMLEVYYRHLPLYQVLDQ
ncbi:MAG: hypothetical protein O3C40_00745 [Planctomycetota bacterium]|nr:hypothetical protein [Planctomycetota bacterium]